MILMLNKALLEIHWKCEKRMKVLEIVMVPGWEPCNCGPSISHSLNSYPESYLVRDQGGGGRGYGKKIECSDNQRNGGGGDHQSIHT